MSRKGNQPIPLPKGVEVKVNGLIVSVKGPKGTLNQEIRKGIDVKVENDHIAVSLAETHLQDGNFHGLYRALIDNMVEGVTKGFERKLEMIGVGYRAAVKGHMLDLQIGCSHPVEVPIPQGIEVKVEKNSTIIATGSNKQVLGQFVATVRAKKPPEPYQGKGIRYAGEFVRKKAGKAASKSK
ncbi:MAG TPA: 50S ribosomal protein L6 [Parachlamydiaceae bacterium]|nr:50S ribosomal protein L6 [Parachlamydiaceae bacterium]